ncbi:amidohydrolase family protein [uncultured Tenacibaculum sp.]|uniref:amidohydrolase family protein n=1 Tax=uncultured Tenacibaculum sp. TaxID=174713 RepID=UPI002614D091|nr:amidohydrolase family protein [uncultured Tenacibaculum sp.]
MKIKLLYTLLFITSFVFSQESFVINNVRLFDGEKVKENVSILIADGKVSKIANEPIQHQNIIDGKGKTLLPGLTNAHVHVWAPASLEQAAQAGVLNLLDMHAVETLIPMMKGFRTSNKHADYYCAGGAATVPKGHGTQYGFPTPTLTKPEEAKGFVEGRVNAGADYIKIIREPWKATLNKETTKALIEATHEVNKKAVVHVAKAADAHEVLKNKADGLVHIWEDTSLTKEQFDDLKEEKFFVVPTLLTMQKVQELFYKKTKEQALEKVKIMQAEVKRLHEIGVPILAGTDPPNGNINYGTDLYKELKLLKEAGLSTVDVLKSATSLPAIHFNLKGKGFLKEGYRADMVLVDGNPTENIEDIAKTKRVFKQGKEVK